MTVIGDLAGGVVAIGSGLDFCSRSSRSRRSTHEAVSESSGPTCTRRCGGLDCSPSWSLCGGDRPLGEFGLSAGLGGTGGFEVGR